MKLLIKSLLVVLLIAASAFSIIGQTHYGLESVVDFRAGRDKEFRSEDKSPLLDLDFRAFKGLNYFENSAAWKIPARYQTTDSEKYFLMPTTTGKSVRYTKVGDLNFEIDGREMNLSAYQSELISTDPEWSKKYGHAFFVPFWDKTNRDETYSGGRYLYMEIPETKDTYVDFNLAFNPSCAYGSDKYSCPIPPRANSLDIRIEAGEKRFEYTKKSKIEK